MLKPSLRLTLVGVFAFAHGALAQAANYNIITEAHGIIGCIAWVIFFPLGAVILRLLSSPRAWLVHALIMTFAYAMFITSAGMGIWMAIVSHQVNFYHPIIGMVLVGATFFQPIGGLLHHYFFSKQKKQEIVAMTHIWLGRALITLGIINGGLGFIFGGDPTRSEDIAYGVVAGVIWVSWIFVVIAVPLKRGQEIPGTINGKLRASARSSRFDVDKS